MAVKIKFCGLTRREDIDVALELGIESLGIVFCRESPRFVEPKKAKKLLSDLPDGLQKVGVFVNSSREEIAQIVDEVGLNTIQLHGSEDPKLLDGWGTLSIWRAVRAQSWDYVESQLKYYPQSKTILFDAYSPYAFGGSGLQIAYDVISIIRSHGLLERSYIAGGLNPDNVGDLLSRFKPLGIDVASGIESAPGIKDHQRMKQMVENVRRVEDAQ